MDQRKRKNWGAILRIIKIPKPKNSRKIELRESERGEREKNQRAEESGNPRAVGVYHNLSLEILKILRVSKSTLSQPPLPEKLGKRKKRRTSFSLR